jgi:hypothetical protein
MLAESENLRLQYKVLVNDHILVLACYHTVADPFNSTRKLQCGNDARWCAFKNRWHRVTNASVVFEHELKERFRPPFLYKIHITGSQEWKYTYNSRSFCRVKTSFHLFISIFTVSGG